MYKQQADLLLELAKLDARLDEIDDERARAEHDKQLYEDERGGDVRKELVVGLRGLYDEASSDDEVEVLLGDGEARLASRQRGRRPRRVVALWSSRAKKHLLRGRARTNRKQITSQGIRFETNHYIL